MERCKYCIHCDEDYGMENNLAMGIALGTVFFPQYRTVFKCTNYRSPYYQVEVESDFYCVKFEK